MDGVTYLSMFVTAEVLLYF